MTHSLVPGRSLPLLLPNKNIGIWIQQYTLCVVSLPSLRFTGYNLTSETDPGLKYYLSCPPTRPRITTQYQTVAAPHGVILNESRIPTPETTHSPIDRQKLGSLPASHNTSSMSQSEQVPGQIRVDQVGTNEGQCAVTGGNTGVHPAQEQPQSFAIRRPDLTTYNAFIQSLSDHQKVHTDPTNMAVAPAFLLSGDPRQVRQAGPQVQRIKLEQIQYNKPLAAVPRLDANSLRLPEDRAMSASPNLTAGDVKQIQRQRSISVSSRPTEMNPQQSIRNQTISAPPRQEAGGLQDLQINISMPHFSPHGNFQQMQQRHQMPTYTQPVPHNPGSVQFSGSQHNYFANIGFQQMQHHIPMPVSPRLTDNQGFMQHNDTITQPFSTDGFQQMQHSSQNSISSQFISGNFQQTQQIHPSPIFQGAGIESMQPNYMAYASPQLFANVPQLPGSDFQQMYQTHRTSVSPHLPTGFIKNPYPDYFINPYLQVSASTFQHVPTFGNGSPMEYYIPSPPQRFQQSANNDMTSPTPLPRVGPLQHSQHSQHRLPSEVPMKRDWDTFQEGEEPAVEPFLRPGFPSTQ